MPKDNENMQTELIDTEWTCPHCGEANHLYMNIPKGYLKCYPRITIMCDQCFKDHIYELKHDLYREEEEE